VIVPIYNREADVAPLLASLYQQDFPRDQVEYIIVDNASGDRTRYLIEGALGSGHDGNWNVRLLAERDIQSSYAARNRGILAAFGRLFVFTDSDCRPNADWLSQIVAPFADESVGIVAGQVDPVPSRGCVERYSAQRNAVSQQGTLAHPFRPYGQTANLAVRRSVIERTGMFRPFLLSGGDADLCWRAAEGGWQVCLAANAIVCHRHRANVRGLIEQYRRYATGAVHMSALFGYEPEVVPSYLQYMLHECLMERGRRGLQAVESGRLHEVCYALLDLVCLYATKSGTATANAERLVADVPPLPVV
jgi:GT2 family glycosyltransferase